MAFLIAVLVALYTLQPPEGRTATAEAGLWRDVRALASILIGAALCTVLHGQGSAGGFCELWARVRAIRGEAVLPERLVMDLKCLSHSGVLFF